MSKSRRAKENRSAELAKRLALENDKKKQERRQNLIGILAVICGLAVIAVVYFSAAFYNNGTIMRRRISMESANHQINNCMLSYYVYEEYRDFINLHYEDLDSVYKLDSKKSLKKQDSTLEDGSWYDYFVSRAREDLETLLLYAEAAEDAGLQLDSEDRAAIDARIKDLQESADAQGYSNNEYYEFMYGRGVREEDLRDCFALEALADKYQQTYVEDAFSYTDAELEAGFNENPKAHAAVDYLYLTITPDYEEDADETAKAAAKEAAAQWVERFKTCSSVADFQQTAKEYTAAMYNIDPDDTEVMELLNVSMYYTSEGVTYTDNDFGNAAFDSAVKAGDIIVTGTADTQYTIYCITKPMYKPTYLTANIGLIPFSSNTFGSIDTAQSYAERAHSSFAEDPTAEKFAELSETYSSDYNLTKNGGRITDAKRGQLNSLVENWVFEEGRKAGDNAVVQSTDGSYLVWYIGEGHMAWQSGIITDLYEEFEAEHLAGLKEKHPITVNEKQMQKLSL